MVRRGGWRRKIVAAVVLILIILFTIDYQLSETLDDSLVALEPFSTDENEKIVVGRKIFKPLENGQNVKFVQIAAKIYASTSFLDERNGNMGYPFVRVLMVMRNSEDFKCKFGEKESPVTSVYELSENHNMHMRTYILNCKIPASVEIDSLETFQIKLTKDEKYTDLNITYRVPDEKKISQHQISLSICVPALFGSVYKPRRIVEFAELNALQGVQRVYIYGRKSIFEDFLNTTLQFYVENNFFELVEIELPFGDSEIWYHGQLISITDCLLRNIGVSEFTSFNDIDEFFIPMVNKTLIETIRDLFSENTASLRVVAQYMSLVNGSELLTLNSTVTSERIVEKRLTKCILRPEMVFEQGIHHTSRVIQDNYTSPTHDGSEVRLFHYREGRVCCRKDDTVPRLYGNELTHQFRFVKKLLNL
ncbi:unnamed protein product [Caenorhabditis auriculariae]|uniref:Glycosyltransferase family 92 protein n=1 Tax=Caenorhabditis auriculariae TaxID=2777116 RepID=A0A8S1HMI2_9PELO|nr:unnamed protein product [Caenorhabditis auriculariae]